jgi:hypothetical protein
MCRGTAAAISPASAGGTSSSFSSAANHASVSAINPRIDEVSAPGWRAASARTSCARTTATSLPRR